MVNLEEQFTQIFQTHFETVWRYSARRVGDDLAFDVAAESFLIAWRRFHELPDEAEVLPWLLGVARKVVANEQRRQRRGNRLIGKLAQFASTSAPVHGIYSSADTSLRDVAAAMRSLPLRDQEALQLVCWDGLSASAAARVVGCSASAMANRIQRARQRLDAALARPSARSTAERNAPRSEEEVAYENR